MTNEQLIAKYNPANADRLTPEDLSAMRALTDEQIDILAKAYPNQPTRRSYLRLWDDKLPENKQLFQLSTWQNLNNVRKFSNMKNLRPYDFILAGNRLQTPKSPGANRGAAKQPAKKVVVDMTAQDAAKELKESLTGDKKQPQAPRPRTGRGAKAAAEANLKAVKDEKPADQTTVNKSDTPADQEIISPE